MKWKKAEHEWNEASGAQAGKGRDSLRYQVLLTLLALDVLGLGAWDVNICGEGSILQQIVEGIQIIRLKRGETHKVFSLMFTTKTVLLWLYVLNNLKMKALVLQWIVLSPFLPPCLRSTPTYIKCTFRLRSFVSLDANWWASVTIEPV